jgi:hypothetical protein
MCLINYHAMKIYGVVYVHLQEFLTSALEEGEWWASCLGRLNPGNRALGTHWIGGWLGGPKSRYWHCAERKFLTLDGNQTTIPRSSRPQRVSIPTELSRLQINNKLMNIYSVNQQRAKYPMGDDATHSWAMRTWMTYVQTVSFVLSLRMLAWAWLGD